MSSRLAPRRTVAFAAALAMGASLFVIAAATPASAADPCGVGGNPVACENSKPGADPSEWDIVGAGDDGIQGFSTDISVNVGSTIGFKIKTAARAYTIDIYRTGYYQGLGARKIASVSPSATLPQTQPQCVTDAATEIYDCGNWAVSASWAVPSTAVSGVYIARLHDPATDDESHITFIVRNDASTSAVLFQTSDPTWQAYNSYGGSDFYQGAANGRAYKISYNRPFATRDLEGGRDFYFSAEYATVRFLERNGYDVSYTSGVDTDRRGALIKNHKTFLSVGHDEYWSAAQRANVEAARDAGVNLAFLSGNEVYWHTRYENSVAGTATSYRTLVSYKETWSNEKIDPTTEWTGTWRDPRLASTSAGAGKPENSLSGTLYMSNFSDLPVTVSSDEGKLRLWRNTNLTAMAAGATAALAPHTIGYESDEDLDNGARPPGLIRLSTTTGAVPQYLRDFGNTVTAGTTTHHLTLYRAGSGALVFSAGSIQWGWGLDQTHDGDGAAPDSRMQQATVNLLADMGAQPATLMSGLVAATASSDHTGPTTIITAPAAGAAVLNGASITVSGTATDVGGRVAGVEVSTDAGATWHPAAGTSPWSYSFIQSGLGAVPVQARAVDDSANIGATATRSVTVSCPCSIYGATVPATPAVVDPSAVELGLRFTPTASGFITGVRFYKGSGNTGAHVGTLWSASGSKLATVAFTNESATGWQTAAFTSAVAVTAGTTYVVSYTAPAGNYAVQADAFWSSGRTAPPLSVAGGFGAAPAGVFGSPSVFPDRSYSSTQYYVDVVYSPTDTTPLTVGSFAPVSGSTSVPVGTPVTAVFSKPVTASSVVMSLAGPGGSAVPGTTSYDATSRTATFTPTSAMAALTSYTATIAATADGASVTGTSSWSFTTAAPAQVAGARTLSFYDDSAVPAVLDSGDPGAVTVGIRFASSVAGTVSAIRFYKGPNNTGTHVGTLWAVGGAQPLAQATFTNESTMGWQTVTFATPVHISKDVEYIAAYRTPSGRYSVTPGAFSSGGLQRAPLRTAAESGAYSYADAKPASTSSASYLVDVVFTQDAPPLVVTAQSPAPGELGVIAGRPISLTFNAALNAGASISLATSSGAVAGSSSRSADGRTLTFVPTSSLPVSTSFTATASGLTSADAAPSPDLTWTFSSASADGCPCTLFGGVVPTVVEAADASSVELGVAFTPSVSGLVTGVRFYKAAGNGGSHTGSLWSSTGQLLRTVTFSGETSTGWQTATFSAPYETTPGTTYVISYLAPQGHYSVTPSALASGWVTGPLSAPASGNGRYAYGGGFPSNSWQNANYFVDVVFAKAAPSAPVVVGRAPAQNATGVSVGSAVSATLSKAPGSGTPALALVGPSGPIAGTSAFDASSLAVTFVPAAALPEGVTITATVTLDGASLAGGQWTFATATAPVGIVSLWADSEVPANPTWNDPSSVQVGTRFTTSVAGTVTAIRFYKGLANTGVHTVNLWGGSNELLAQAPSTSESAAGWQTVPLPSPVAIVPGQTYTAAYHSTTGMYAVTSNGLASARTSGPLSTVVPGGAYVYGTGFPSGSSSAAYGVDLVFVPSN